MDFELTSEQKMIIDVAAEIAKKFGPEYWREKDRKHEFGEEFWRALVDAGIVGLMFPEEYGGGNLGMLEMALAMETLAAEGCGLAGPWYLVLTSIFGGVTLLKHGSKEQKEKYLPIMAKGGEFCMALTEPDAGTNTFNIKTFARQEGDKYIINGQKIFISGADRAKGMLIVARTTPPEKAPKRSLGITLFVVDLPNPAVEVIPIEKHGIHYSNSCEVYVNELEVSKENIVGEKDRGWYNLLDTLNTERITFSVACVGIGLLALKKAAEYAKVRNVFGVPIGAHQGVQFPLAASRSKLEAARLLTYKAAKLFDENKPCGAETNMAKVVAVEAGIEAVYHSMQTFGGYGYAVEYDVERWWREINLVRLAPITHQMALAFVGEHVLGLPKSY